MCGVSKGILQSSEQCTSKVSDCLGSGIFPASGFQVWISFVLPSLTGDLDGHSSPGGVRSLKLLGHDQDFELEFC